MIPNELNELIEEATDLNDKQSVAFFIRQAYYMGKADGIETSLQILKRKEDK